MKTYCDTVESLKIKVILVGLQTLSDSQKYGDRTLGDVLSRFVKNGIDLIKQDERTQEEVATYLFNDPEDCNRSIYLWRAIC